MIFKIKECEPIGTNAYFLGHESSGKAILIDAPLGSYHWAQELCYEHSLSLVGLLLTHGHWDHILDAHLFSKEGTIIYGHQADKLIFEDPAIMSSFSLPGIELKGFSVNHWLSEKDTLSIADFTFDIFEVPGHCPGSLLFFLKEQLMAFSGDAIFAGGIGRYDLPGGSFELLKQSILNKIYTLPTDTILYPGHGPKTSVGVECHSNPYVQL